MFNYTTISNLKQPIATFLNLVVLNTVIFGQKVVIKWVKKRF